MDPARQQLHAALRQAVCLLAVALPWLAPFAGGPSVSVSPWLFALCAGAALAAAGGLARLPVALWGAALALGAWAFARGNGGLDAYAVCGALGLMLLSAGAGASVGRREDDLRAVAWGLLLAALVSAAMALWQHQGFARGGGWISAAPAGEAYANLRQRNQFATLTVIGLCALAWLFARGLRLSLALPMVVLLAAADAATTSRTGLLQLALLALFAMALPGARRRARLALSLTALATWAAASVLLPALLRWRGLAGAGLFDRVAGVSACSSRKVLWSNVLELIAQRPVLGWGWGELDYAHFAHLYAGPRFCDILDNAHNLPLHLAVELGLPAAALVVLALAWGALRQAPWREQDGTRRLAWALLAVIGLHSLVEYPLWYGPFQMTAGFALGLLCAHGARPMAAATRMAWPALALLAAAYASWDYWRVGQVYLPVEARAKGYAGNTLARIGDSRLFRDQAGFAALTLTPLTEDNAPRVLEQAQALLHFSPEPRVIERVLDSARMVGREDLVGWHAVRLRAAFPDDYAAWAAHSGAEPKR